ncbi:MAG TPA: response regulator, partial [Acetobacteraceae bacterium]|nr:response regulator [Acetobacteraceae bacterium]
MAALRTIHVVDDDEAVRDSLRTLLESSGLAVHTYPSAALFLEAAPGILGCVLTDVRMPDMDGLALQRRLNERGLHLPVIVMTGQGDIAVAVRAMKAGALDFLEKPFHDDDLLAAVERALAEGERRQAREEISGEAARRMAALTAREREVLDLLVTGLPTKGIANALGASPRTIEVHRARVFEKLHARSLPELVRLVIAAGAEGGQGPV